MRYIVTFLWSFLLMQMITYVVSSMAGAAYSFSTGVIIAVIVTLLVFALTAILPKAEPAENHH